VSTIVFFRHAQAGTRDNYDQISDLGEHQARLLGDFFTHEGLRFHRLLTGPFLRQRRTAELAGLTAEVDPAWAEFDLDAVMARLVPRMQESDMGFAARYRRQQAIIDSGDAAVHRAWTEVDGEVVKAWIEDRFPCATEPWAEFHSRIEGALNRLRSAAPEEVVAVSTSAAPIGIAVGLAHGLKPAQEMGLAGAMFNTAITVLRATPDQLSVVSFNGVPHLAAPHLRTLR
jgi:broad specificity phosphatase PhoE